MFVNQRRKTLFLQSVYEILGCFIRIRYKYSLSSILRIINAILKHLVPVNLAKQFFLFYSNRIPYLIYLDEYSQRLSSHYLTNRPKGSLSVAF